MSDAYDQAADRIARDHVATTFRNWEEFDVALTRNAMLDVLGVSRTPDFIARITSDRLNGRHAQRTLRRVAPDLVQLTGRLVQELRA